VIPPSESRRELDSAVVNIELSLASIIQGVALFFLTDNARASISARHGEIFIYVAAGLCVNLYFLVTVNHSHAYVDQMAPRLRAWRVNSFQPAR
jgi:hypothetical protein